MTEVAPVATDAERVAALESAITRASMMHGRLASRTHNEAVFEFGQNPNHILHAILSIFLCGLWLPIWAIVAMSTKVTRRTVLVDEWGRTWITAVSGDGWQAF